MTRQGWARIGVGAWLLGLAITTSVRANVWQSDASLWSDAVRKAPDKPRCVLNDGRTHELAKDVVYAEAAYRKAISLSFDSRRSAYVQRFTRAAAEVNLAHLRMNAGEFSSAMQILDQVLVGWPQFPYAWYNRASILWAYGMCDEAMKGFVLALAGDPTLPRPKGVCEPRPWTP